MELDQLFTLIEQNENWILQRVSRYSKKHNYSPCTPTLEEAWRISVAGLSKDLLAALSLYEQPNELNPDEFLKNDAVASFAIKEAKLHRQRGISLSMFLGLMKYYRQSYIDLIRDAGFAKPQEEFFRLCVDRYFDRIEIAFCVEWTNTGETKQIGELQTNMRIMTNEKNRFLTIFESLPLPIILLDQTSRLENINYAAAKLCNETQLPGANYYGSEDGNKLVSWLSSDLDAFIASGKFYYVITKELPTNMSSRVFEIHFTRMLDVSEKFCGTIIVFDDITLRKQMEQETLKISKLESLGILAGGIAHDFNNYLTVITGNISMARMKVSKENSSLPARLFLEEAEKASVQAKNLTQRLLTFAKGGSPILRTASIADILNETASFALSGSNVSCQMNIAEGLWPVEIDEEQINQVIHNIIINGAQAMPEGGTIELAAANTEITPSTLLPLKYGLYVRVSIKDSGHGIAQENLGKIFDPYFTTKKVGSGLGLATAYSIVIKHNGYIVVESAESTGTCFHIYIPALPKESAHINKPENKTHFGNGKILVMDDNEMLRTVLSEMLNFLGYEALSSGDGKEAVNLYEEAKNSGRPFQAAIIDLTVPGGMGGQETIQELLKIDPDFKAIVSSGYSNDPVMAEYGNYGFRAVIKKPYNIEELSTVLQSLA